MRISAHTTADNACKHTHAKSAVTCYGVGDKGMNLNTRFAMSRIKASQSCSAERSGNPMPTQKVMMISDGLALLWRLWSAANCVEPIQAQSAPPVPAYNPGVAIRQTTRRPETPHSR